VVVTTTTFPAIALAKRLSLSLSALPTLGVSLPSPPRWPADEAGATTVMLTVSFAAPMIVKASSLLPLLLLLLLLLLPPDSSASGARSSSLSISASLASGSVESMVVCAATIRCGESATYLLSSPTIAYQTHTQHARMFNFTVSNAAVGLAIG
jgi:hypothetical protein